MRVYNDFFLVPGSRSMFPDTDPDPKHWYLLQKTSAFNQERVKTEFTVVLFFQFYNPWNDFILIYLIPWF